MRKKTELTQIITIKNEREDSTTIEPTKFKMMRKEYCEQLYAYTFDNSDEMDQFLKGYNLPMIAHEKKQMTWIEHYLLKILNK